ncbi:hypothetical protein CEXT_218261 [Caerostris extrusa]|uniref:Uncharacterized protein n=1 Tax=Caerostris extrusa TaxID=172846 RepID=A0AAV4TZH4_CAEEX|nr:hypothetical protein CEXT_218261 [Caerostris extrusa]
MSNLRLVCLEGGGNAKGCARDMSPLRNYMKWIEMRSKGGRIDRHIYRHFHPVPRSSNRLTDPLVFRKRMRLRFAVSGV